jgi:hypothetical protein
MTKADFQTIYTHSGYKTDDTIQRLMELNTVDHGILGRDVSEDKSLAIFELKDFAVVVGWGGVSFIDKN